MTEREAIEEFKDQIEYAKRYERYDLVKRYELAIAALEKQIGKKPNVVIDGYSFGHLEWTVCDNCELEVESDFEYCSNCGTKIDWSKE